MRIKSNKPCVKDTLSLKCGDITIKFDEYEAGYKVTFNCYKNDSPDDHIAVYEFLDQYFSRKLNEIFYPMPSMSFLNMNGTIEFEMGFLRQTGSSVYFSMKELQYEWSPVSALLTHYEMLISSSHKNFDKFEMFFEILKKDNLRKMEAMKNARQSNRIKY